MKKIVLFILILVILGGIACGGYFLYNNYWLNTNTQNKTKQYIYIDESKDYTQLRQYFIDSLQVEDVDVFDRLAKQYNVPQSLKTGKYQIDPNDNARNILKKMTRGLQVPTRVVFNNVRLKRDLTEVVSKQLMFSEQDLLNILNDSIFCSNYGYDTTTIVTIFLPNTYEFYWNTTPEEFVERMNKEYKKFWNEDRRKKAEKLNLTPEQVSSLAAIVEEECSAIDEYPIVARLYLNRLNRGQLLQADPTLKYAAGDFTLKRVLNKHKEIDSPYNTYKYQGLPPSPIRIPNIKAIDAVLNPDDNNYLYMCAKEDFSGRHNFTTNLSEHNRNAQKYQAALNKRNIFK